MWTTTRLDGEHPAAFRGYQLEQGYLFMIVAMSVEADKCKTVFRHKGLPEHVHKKASMTREVGNNCANVCAQCPCKKATETPTNAEAVCCNWLLPSSARGKRTLNSFNASSLCAVVDGEAT
jgi:hypothetical protein